MYDLLTAANTPLFDDFMKKSTVRRVSSSDASAYHPPGEEPSLNNQRKPLTWALFSLLES
jgi:hypothetical protein